MIPFPWSCPNFSSSQKNCTHRNWQQQWAMVMVKGIGLWTMGHGQWVMSNGRWARANGQWLTGNSRWAMAGGQWQMGNGRGAMAMDNGKCNWQQLWQATLPLSHIKIGSHSKRICFDKKCPMGKGNGWCCWALKSCDEIFFASVPMFLSKCFLWQVKNLHSQHPATVMGDYSWQWWPSKLTGGQWSFLSHEYLSRIQHGLGILLISREILHL